MAASMFFFLNLGQNQDLAPSIAGALIPKTIFSSPCGLSVIAALSRQMNHRPFQQRFDQLPQLRFDILPL